MNDDMDMDNRLEIAGDSGIMQWLPRFVVVVTIVGFVSLAWYAYRTGTQSIKDEDLIVVEADKTPMKEKPADPGGMQFPNQDKTIFETFSNATQNPPKVERVLPAPEEPIAKPAEMAETTTFVNEKLQKKDEGQLVKKPETILPVPEKTPPKEAILSLKEGTLPPPPVENKKAQVDDSIVSYTMDKKGQKTAAAEPVAKEKPQAMLTEVKATPKEEEPKEKPAPVKSDSAKVKVQLGAYRSQTEAKTAFGSMQKKFPQLAGKSPVIVKADLGEKGIYYRLRVGAGDSDADAKALCKTLSAKGQACIVAP